jgi:hypothetical protein
VLFAQNNSIRVDTNLFRLKNTLELRIHRGGIMPNNSTLDHLLTDPYTSLEMRFGWQSYGHSSWNQLFNNPIYGFGYYQSVLHAKDYLGNPSALYFFFNAPFKKGRRLEFRYDVGVGVSYDFTEYDPDLNPENDLIGSNINVYFSGALEAVYKMTERSDISLGVDLTHFSNGRTRTPNKGVNLIGFNMGYRYYIMTNKRYDFFKLAEKKRPNPYFTELPEFKPYIEYYTVFSGGVTTTELTKADRNLKYGAGSITIDAVRHYSHASKYGVGFDIFYDGSQQESYEGSSPGSKELWYYGVHIGHELKIFRFTAIVQLGFNLVERISKGDIYSRISLRYDINDKVFARVGLKTLNGAAADFIEWGVGYTINYKRYKNLRVY